MPRGHPAQPAEGSAGVGYRDFGRGGWGALAQALIAAGLLACDHGLEEVPSGRTGIAGRVVFAGEWPAGVGQVAVAVYREVPQALADFFALAGADDKVALGAAEYAYFVPLPGDAVYAWVVVAWRAEGAFWDFRSLLGCYHVSGDSLPTPVPVRRGAVTEGIDIAVDLRALRGESLPEQDLCKRALPADLLASRDQGG
ncbi:MAG: hypothetical protein AB1505_07080 [Candidatus Latescibacterota bacterium]